MGSALAPTVAGVEVDVVLEVLGGGGGGGGEGGGRAVRNSTVSNSEIVGPCVLPSGLGGNVRRASEIRRLHSETRVLWFSSSDNESALSPSLSARGSCVVLGEMPLPCDPPCGKGSELEKGDAGSRFAI